MSFEFVAGVTPIPTSPSASKIMSPTASIVKSLAEPAVMAEPSIVMLSTVTLAADALPEAVIFPILVKFLEESITVVFDEPIFIVFTNKLSHILLVNPKEDIAVVSGLKAPPLSLPASHLTPLAVLEEFKALISICPLASC